uniref:Cationic amino acid transporter C-terminal domain-containing protein n=2 Tax=Corethron hystrix TaxID=216773 RepID=A0A7S1FLW3_9STRA|mmetsp:Transcript_14729/g.32540  ORF Transcript_14729/g.32540 Transcript_14729/m.32540 type:complete len:324 (+) Transcript_14729:416-1387(+)
MVPYTHVSDTSGFPDALSEVGLGWAGNVAAAGEVATLPIVILIGLMAQPWLMAALAEDGLVPQFFGKVDRNGNLICGIVAVGSAMVIIASVVPFAHLNDTISAGVLVCFSMTSTSLVLLRLRSPSEEETSMFRGICLRNLVGYFNFFSFATAVGTVHAVGFWGNFITVLLGIVAVALCTIIHFDCPERQFFGEEDSCDAASSNYGDNEEYFRTPLVPWIPCLSIFLNHYLISQLDLMAILMLLLYLGVAVSFYMCYGLQRSVLRRQKQWLPADQNGLFHDREEHEVEDDKEDKSGILMCDLVPKKMTPITEDEGYKEPYRSIN